MEQYKTVFEQCKTVCYHTRRTPRCCALAPPLLLVVSMMKERCCHELEAAIMLVQVYAEGHDGHDKSVYPTGVQCWNGQTRQCDQIIRARKKNLKFAMLCLKLGSVASSIF
jgi:hypothetical protein